MSPTLINLSGLLYLIIACQGSIRETGGMSSYNCKEAGVELEEVIEYLLTVQNMARSMAP